MTSIAMPILDYAILAIGIMILIGLPTGLLVKRRKVLNYQILGILISLVIGVAVVLIEYVHLIDWCYSLEQMPFGLAVACENFLPEIQCSALIGIVLAILLAYYVNRR
ncbi:MAG: hypothetical protein JW779_09770 [Candidatus Thorarchaeota archaeon]|nr:hypothetical protein [Candidatus Thorarchaeota archaeon]